MTTEQEKFLEEIDKRYTRMRNALFAIIGILISAWVVQFYLSGVRLGRLEVTVENNIKDIDFLQENFMPFWYGDGMVKLFNIHTERIVATIGGDQEQVKRLDADFQRQFSVIQESIIKSREGFNPKITRSLIPGY
jgi:hypothetical protein